MPTSPTLSDYVPPRCKDRHVQTYDGYHDLIVSTWPSIEYSGLRLYQHDDSWHGLLWDMQGTLAARDYFVARPTDVLLCSFPKCGTTWAKAILFAVVHRGGDLQPEEEQEPERVLATLNPHECVPMLESQVFSSGKGLPPSSVQSELVSLPSPRLFSTHIPAISLPPSVLASGCRVVYICRDPKDAFVSRWHYTNSWRVKEGVETLTLADGFDFFCRGHCPFGSYWDHVLGYRDYSRRNPGKVLFLRYEAMVEDTASSVRGLAKFIGSPFSEKEEEKGVVDDIVRLCSFDSLRGKQVNKLGSTEFGLVRMDNSSFFRQGKAGDWVNYLTPVMAERIDKITAEKLGGSYCGPGLD